MKQFKYIFIFVISGLIFSGCTRISDKLSGVLDIKPGDCMAMVDPVFDKHPNLKTAKLILKAKETNKGVKHMSVQFSLSKESLIYGEFYNLDLNKMGSYNKIECPSDIKSYKISLELGRQLYIHKLVKPMKEALL